MFEDIAIGTVSLGGLQWMPDMLTELTLDET